VPSVLVTGGAGFIGSHLVDGLLARGQRVRVLDDFSTGKWENLERHRAAITVLEGDVRDRETVRRAVQGCEVVFHEAAIASVPLSFEQPELVLDVNVAGTGNVLEAARAAGARRRIFASSCAVYGDPAELPVPETAPLQPGSPYAESKLAGETACREATARGELECVCLRYFNVFGPRQDPSSDYSGVIARFAEAARRGAPCTVYGDGGQTRDFVYVADVVRANLLATTCALHGGEPVNVGSGVETSVLDIVRALEIATGRSPARSSERSLARPLEVLHLPARQGDVRRSLASTEVARRELGFAAALSFVDGLRATLGEDLSGEGLRGASLAGEGAAERPAT